MNRKELFSTRQRIKILEALVFKTEPISVNHVAAQLKLSKGLISKYLDLLVREGIAKRKGNKFLICQSASLTKGIKILLSIWRVDTKIFRKHSFVQAAGLYGSAAKGENTEESDIDLWVRVDKAGEDDQAVLSAKLREQIKNINILFLSSEKIRKLKEDDELFYRALSFGSVVLYGDSNALEL